MIANYSAIDMTPTLHSEDTTADARRRMIPRIVTLLVVFSVLTYVNRTMMSIAAPTVIKLFGLSETQMGLVFSAFLLSYSIFMVPGGWLADKFGPKKILFQVGVGSGIAMACTALAGKPGLGALIGVLNAFIVARFLLGIATAPIYPASARMNADWVPLPYRARVQGAISAGAGIGGALSPFLYVWMAAAWGWRGTFLAGGLMTVAAAVAWQVLVADRPPSLKVSRPANTGEPWWRFLRNSSVLALAAAYFATNYFMYIFFYWVYYYFGTIRHMSENETTLYTTILFVFWTFMCPLGGWVSDRLVAQWGKTRGRRVVPIVGLLVSGALLMVGINLPSAMATGIVLAFSLGFAASTDGAFWATAIDLGGGDAGSGSAIVNTIGNVGGLVSTTLTPIIASQFGWKSGLYAGSLLVMASVLLWAFVKPGNETS